jgi:hypothetical protein
LFPFFFFFFFFFFEILFFFSFTHSRGFVSMASDSWFSDEPTWKRVLISIATQKFLVYPESLESCMHQIDVSDVVAVAVTDTTKRAFELAFRAPAPAEDGALAAMFSAPAPAAVQLATPPGMNANFDGAPTLVERFRFRCDTEEELRQWIAVTERWCDHWRSKSARATVVENLLAQLDASDATMRQLAAVEQQQQQQQQRQAEQLSGSSADTSPEKRSIVVNGDAGVQDLDEAAMDARTLSNRVVVLIHALEAQPLTCGVATTVRRLTQHYEHELKAALERVQVAERERNAAKMREERIEAALRKTADENITLKEMLSQCKRDLADTQSARDEVCHALVEAKLAAADKEQQHWNDLQRERKLRTNSNPPAPTQ